jgi:GTP cyclohydrolase I
MVSISFLEKTSNEIVKFRPVSPFLKSRARSTHACYLCGMQEPLRLDHERNHHSGNAETPLRADAFNLSDSEKRQKIQEHVRGILETLGMDLSDDSLRGTPARVAEMFVDEIFGGLHPERKPELSTFENSYRYGEMLVEKNIVLYSTCEHHLLPIVGRAHVAYLSKDRVIGLSKMNRIVDYYAKRPQVQERLTRQIVQALQEALGTADVACVIDAKHLCVNSRGIRDIDSSTVTAEYGGRFQEEAVKREFLDLIRIQTLFGA